MDNINIKRAAYDSAKKDRTSIVFFRVGIFYITVFDDAKLVGEILGLTVKTRECEFKFRTIPNNSSSSKDKYFMLHPSHSLENIEEDD